MSTSAMSAAMALVRRYLDAMEARDLPAARALLAPGFRMLFPGGAQMESLEQLIEWSRPRYQFVRKKYEQFDHCAGAHGATDIVYCYGTLEGRWNDGSDFAGIRFIDRFEIRDGKLADQKVWNDIGAIRPAAGLEGK